MYTGYYCKKCKMIPLIKFNISFNKDIKYMIKCKCHLNYLKLEEINKLYFTKNIEQKDIFNEKLIDEIENDDSLLLKVKEVISKIRNNNKQLLILKNDIIYFLKEKMKKIENMYDKAIKINENLEKLILILIDSYECLNSNYSNIKNIKYQTKINFEKINDEHYSLIDESAFDESIQDSINLIDKYLPIPKDELENISKLCSSSSKDIKIYNNELLFLKTENSIIIYPTKDLKPYAKINLSSLITFDIDKHNNILFLFPECIKIFSCISYEQIKPLIKEETQNFNEIPTLDVKLILIINTKIKYHNLIYWGKKIDENRIIIHNANSIYIFEYDVNKKSSDLFYTFDCELLKIELINFKNSNALLLFNSSNLFFFDLSQLKIIESYAIYFNERNIISTIQISNKELLITINNNIYLLDINDFEFKLKYKYDSFIFYISQLRDKSIVVCDYSCSKRISTKTFENMSVFYINSEKGYYSYGSYIPEYIYIIKFIQISDNKVVLLLSNGECLLKKLTF